MSMKQQVTTSMDPIKNRLGVGSGYYHAPDSNGIAKVGFTVRSGTYSSTTVYTAMPKALRRAYDPILASSFINDVYNVLNLMGVESDLHQNLQKVALMLTKGKYA